GGDWTVTVTPAAHRFGTATVTLTVAGEYGQTATQTFRVTVRPVNGPPAALPDTFDVPANSGATALDVLANDSDGVNGAGPLTIVAVTPGSAGGTVSTDGRLIFYTPRRDFVGAETFDYTVSDGQRSASATVTVRVAPPPAPAEQFVRALYH